MEQFCSRCGQADGYNPDDHDCVGNLLRRQQQLTEGITSEAGWDSLTREELTRVESELADVYSALWSVTEFYDARVVESVRLRDDARGRQQIVRTPLNAVRAELRERYAPVEE